MGEEKDVFFRPVGLVLDPSERLAPQGSLRRAENVTLKRQGILEPRPGFKSIYTAGDGAPPSELVRRLFPYSGKLLSSGDVSGTWAHYWSTSFSVAISGIGNPPSGRYPKSAAMRKSLYTTSGTGIKKLTSSSDTAAESAGVEILQGELTHVAAVGATPMLANGVAVAYRYVLKRTDANGYILRSAPTPWTEITNTHATDGRDIQIVVPLASTNVAGDTIELYRSAAVTPPTEASDELYLAQSYTITSTDVSNTYATLTDSLAEALLGAALYSNATEQGNESAKEVPPLARDLAEFGGCMFYLYTTSRQRILALCKSARGNSDTTFGLTYGGNVVNYTINQYTMTGITPDTTNIRVGMTMVESGYGKAPTDAGTDYASDARVVSVDSSSQVTLDKPALATGATKTVTFVDRVMLNSTDFYAWSATTPSKRSFYCIPASGEYATLSDTKRARMTLANLAYVVNRNQTAAVPKCSAVAQDSGALLVFEERALGGATFTLIMSPRTYWDRDYGVSLTSAPDEYKNRLMWSSVDEPEAVPLANYTPVGNELKEGIRLVPTRDALFIFKQDGCFKLTGTYPNWRVDPHDPILLLAEDGVTTFEDQVVAWTDRGVVVGGLSGFESISRDTIESDIIERQNVNVAFPASPYRASMTAISPESLLVFGVASSGSDGKASKLYVFSAKTHGWTTWELTPRCTAYDPSDGKMYFGSNSTTYDIRKEKKTESSTTDNSDLEYTITVTTVTGNAVLLNNLASGYSPAVGDALKTGSSIAIITAVTDTTHVTVDDGTVLTDDTSCTAYKPFQTFIEAIGVDAQDPSCLKQFAHVDYVFEDTRHTYAAAFAARGDEDFTGESETATQTRPTSAQFKEWSWIVPRSCAIGTRIYPSLATLQACTLFKFSGFSVRYTRLRGTWRT